MIQKQNEEDSNYQKALKKLIITLDYSDFDGDVENLLWAFRHTLQDKKKTMENYLAHFSDHVKSMKDDKDYAQRLIEYLEKFIFQQEAFFKVQIAKQKDLIEQIETNCLKTTHIEEGIGYLNYEPLKDWDFFQIMEKLKQACEKLENICIQTQAQYEYHCKNGDQHYFPDHKLVAFRPQKNFSIEAYDYVGSQPVIHFQPITAVSISKDETLLASTGQDNYLKIWSLQENQILRQVNLNEEALHVCFSNCSNYVYLGLSDGRIKKLQIINNQQTLYQVHSHSLIYNFSFIIELAQDKIASASEHSIRITEFKQDKQIKITTRTQFQSNIEYSIKNNFILSMDYTDLCIWDADTGIELWRVEKIFPIYGKIQSYLSPSESKIASICQFDEGIRLFRLDYEKKLLELEEIYDCMSRQIFNISWGLDDQTLVCCCVEYFVITQLDCKKKWRQLQFQDHFLDKFLIMKQIPTFKYLFGFWQNQLIVFKYQPDAQK